MDRGLQRFGTVLSLGFFLLSAAWSAPDEHRRLEPGKTLEDVLAPGQTKSFHIETSAGQYLQIAIAKPDLNFVGRLLAPNGDEEIRVESPEDGEETLSLSWVSSKGGIYRFEAQRRRDNGGEGHYKLSVSEPRPARPEDEKRAAAEKAYAQATQASADRSGQGMRQQVAKLETALALWREIGDRTEQARTLGQIGARYPNLGESKKALEYLSQALSLSRDTGDSRIEAGTLNAMAAAHSNMGDPAAAKEYHRQALALYRRVKHKRGEAATLSNMGRTYLMTGEPAKAVECFLAAQALWHLVGDSAPEARALSGISSAYVELGDLQKALEFNGQSLALVRQSDDRRTEAALLISLAEIDVQLGALQKALNHRTQALSLARSIDDVVNEGSALAGIGHLYKQLGEPERALDYYHQALPLLEKTNDRRRQASILNLIGMVHSVLGESQRALEYYQRALLLQRAVAFRRGEAETLTAIGDLHLALNELPQALADHESALSINRSIGNLNGQINDLIQLGAVRIALGETQRAFESLNEALQIAHANRMEIKQSPILYQLARAERQANHLPEAVARIRAATDSIEHVRGDIAGSALRASYIANVRKMYELLIELLWQVHRRRPREGFDGQALEASERARARGLLDLLAESKADIRQGVEPALLEREKSLQTTLQAKSEYRLKLLAQKHTEQEKSELEKEIAALSAQYDETEAEIRARSPRYAALTQPQPLGVAEMQRLLDDGTALLEYSLGEERSFLWFVTPRSLDSYELPKRTDVEAAAKRAYAELSVNSPVEELEAVDALSRMLIGPLAEQLGRKRLVIVADGALDYIPFAALRASPGTPLIAEHEIVTAPSASTLAVLRKEAQGRKPAPKVVAVLADPVFDRDDPRLSRGARASTPQPSLDTLERSAKESGLLKLDRLVATRAEAQGIVSLAGKGNSLTALDFDASRRTVTRGDLEQYRIVHLASHALINSQHPELSGMVLSLVDRNGQPQDGFLRAHEIYNLKLNAELVVLSACQTALGKEVKGEGLIGLTRAFMYAGAPRVVASLWRVPDPATAELMKRFYRGMLSGRLRPAAALQKAQVDMSHQKRWSAPYYWAGFTLQGEWK